MFFHKFICLLFINLLVVGCSDDKLAKTSNLIDKQITYSPIGVNDVSCEDEHLCIESFAKTVTEISIKHFHSCNSFLVGENIMAMSASCVSSVLRQAGAPCGGQIYSYFPATKQKDAQQAGCVKIISSSELDTNIDPAYWGKDFIFFQIDKFLDRDYLKLSTSGIREGEKFSSWFMEKVDGKMLVKSTNDCAAVYGSYLNPLSNSRYYPTMILENCPVLGNVAGAPLINNRGELAGIISSRISGELLDSVWDRFFKHMVDTSLEAKPSKENFVNQMSDMVYASNASCLTYKNPRGDNGRRNCFDFIDQFDREHAINRARSNFVKNSQTRINGEFELCQQIEGIRSGRMSKVLDRLKLDVDLDIFHVGNQSEIFQVKCGENTFTITPTFTARLNFHPVCFLDSQLWKDDYRRDRHSSFLSMATVPSTGAVDIPAFGVRMNKSFKLEYYTFDERSISFEFSPKKLFSKKRESDVVVNEDRKYSNLTFCSSID